MVDAGTPVIVGVGQHTVRDGSVDDALTIAEAAARAAIANSGQPTVTSKLDACWVVNMLTSSDPAPATSLGHRLGLPAGERLTTTIGGNTPVDLLARACDLVASGAVRGVLVAGGEAGRSAAGAQRRGEAPPPAASEGADDVVGDARPGAGPAELAISLALPAHLYPWFESALAARAGRTSDEQRAWLGGFVATMGERAARHPQVAWFPEPRTAAEISEVRPDNRMIAEPYTKRMNSILEVDQGAAFAVLAAGEADALGIGRDRWVFPWSSASCTDVFLPSERPDLGRSAGIAAAARAALAAAGRTIDDIDHIDLYSCFPSAVEMGAEALGVAFDDPRGLSLSGGMPAFGGPGNNYATHGIALAVGELRQAPDALALTTGLGWYVTKHAVAILGGRPAPGGWRHPRCTDEQARIDASARPVSIDAEGPGVVVAGTVVHRRGTGPATAPVLVDLPDGRRAVATAGEAVATAVSGGRLVGAPVVLRRGEGASLWEPAG
jgi:acetyl-CoA C-acetyltransferase